MKNVLVLCGGGGTEHEVSLVSAKYFMDVLSKIKDLQAHYLCIQSDGRRLNEKGENCELRKAGEIFNRETQITVKLDYAIPCLHGPPGENGLIPSVFELMGLPYLGSSHEGSILCFNKISTKIWLDRCQIPTTPYVFLASKNQKRNEVVEFFHQNKDVFIKASHQGSSVGCYHVTKEQELHSSIDKAFELSPYVLIERTMKGRELEVAVFEHGGEIKATVPGEIDCPQAFYSYEEKYAKESETKTLTVAPGISLEQQKTFQALAIKAFQILNLKDLARIDFFLTDNQEILINEINTFPGHTPISMFPMMLENTGLTYGDFLKDKIFKN